MHLPLSYLLRFAALLLVLLTPFPSSAAAPIKVTVTTTMVGDLVKRVGGGRVEVLVLMGPGVDPHLYKATASDVNKLKQADAIFYSGLMLEGKMEDLFLKMAKTKKYVYPVTTAIPRELLQQPPQFAGHFDPHVWFEIPVWARCVEAVVKGLGEVDPQGRGEYQKRGETARQQLLELHQWALGKVSELPRERRILVTSHDAYNYFGRAYGFQVVGLQGISTADEAGLADMAKMVDYIKKHLIKAIFVESSVPHNTIERISKDAGVKIGGEIFSDAMGTPGQMEKDYDLGTYEGMIKHNINTIVDSLK